jgi:hypothetical protein
MQGLPLYFWAGFHSDGASGGAGAVAESFSHHFNHHNPSLQAVKELKRPPVAVEENKCLLPPTTRDTPTGITLSKFNFIFGSWFFQCFCLELVYSGLLLFSLYYYDCFQF